MVFDEPVPPRLYDWDDDIAVGEDILTFECHVQDTDDEDELEFKFRPRDYFRFHGSPGDTGGPLYIATV